MRVLTISEPFASLIASGRKFVENRSWPTTYRGPLAIHAGKGTQYRTRKQLEAEFADSVGCIIATCEVVACIELAQPHKEQVEELEAAGISWDAFKSHEHTEGPWCWILSEVRRCEPIKVTGKQGLWLPPDGLLNSNVEQLAY